MGYSNPLCVILARVGLRRFDRKFGKEFLAGLPSGPGIYLFRDDRDEVLYVGKAKDLRRRLGAYRNATRRKLHRKMRVLVREASSLEVREQPSEKEALLAENEVIRTVRPPYNVDGAYSFLYPSIGLRESAQQVLFCFTTRVEEWDGVGFQWYGSFRSRLRAKEAFDALVELSTVLGHREPRNRLPDLPRVRGSFVVAVRRLGAARLAALRQFLAGDSMRVLGEISLDLLEKPRARRDAAEIQESLNHLASFYRADITRLRSALDHVGRGPQWVPQAERDALLIQSQKPL